MAQICGTEPFDGAHWCNYGLEPAIAGRLHPLLTAFVVAARQAGPGRE